MTVKQQSQTVATPVPMTENRVKVERALVELEQRRRREHRSITYSDVARAAGVSISTAYRVIALLISGGYAEREKGRVGSLRVLRLPRRRSGER